MVFTKHAGNPVLTLGAGGTWDDLYAYIPSVIHRNHKWYMYYAGHDGATVRIGLATSPDGIIWTKHTANPLLDISAGGAWDDTHVYYPRVIYRNHKWYMYYTGRTGAHLRIGLATSEDGISWTKHTANPVLDIGAGGAWDDSHVYGASVIYRNHRWYMYYSGYGASHWRIGLATSEDGVSWTKHTGNPVLNIGAGGAWDDVHASRPSVIYRNHKWYMYYDGYDGSHNRIGLATSEDGISWTKHTASPLVSTGAGGTWDYIHAYMPSVIYRNHKWYLYYTGYDGARNRIGLATSPSGV